MNKLTLEYELLKNYFDLLPCRDYKKYPNRKDWRSKKYILKDFENKDVTGLFINFNPIKNSKDLMCFDIDCKNRNGEIFNKVRKVIKKIKKLNYRGVYIEKSVSGKGYHIFVKFEDESLYKYICNEYKLYIDHYIAKDLEVYPQLNNDKNYIAVYPCEAEINGEIKSVKRVYNRLCIFINNYLTYNQLLEVLKYINKIRKIMGKIERNTILNKERNKHDIIIKKVREFNSNYYLRKQISALTKLKCGYLSLFWNEIRLQKEVLLSLDTEIEATNNGWLIKAKHRKDGYDKETYVYYDNPVLYDFVHNISVNILEYLAVYNSGIIDDLFEKYCKVNVDNIYDEIENFDEINYDKYDRTLIFSQTGSGKTNWIINKAIKGEIKIILFEPYIEIVKQKEKYMLENSGIIYSALYEDNYEIKENSQIIIATYDKLPYIANDDIKEYIVVFDEVQVLVTEHSYRDVFNEVYKTFYKSYKSKIIGLTATPYGTGIYKIFDKCYYVKSEKKKNREVELCVCGKKYINDAIITNVKELFKANVKQIIYYDNKKELDNIKNILIKKIGIRKNDISLIHANKETEDKDIIIDRGKLTKKVNLWTRKMSAGISIINKGDVVIHAYITDINALIQTVNRVRYIKGLEGKVKVIIYTGTNNINKYKLTVDENFEVLYNFLKYNSKRFEELLGVSKLIKYKELDFLIFCNGYKLINHKNNKLIYLSFAYVNSLHIVNKNFKEVLKILQMEGFTYIRDIYYDSKHGFYEVDKDFDKNDFMEKIFNVILNKYVPKFENGMTFDKFKNIALICKDEDWDFIKDKIFEKMLYNVYCVISVLSKKEWKEKFQKIRELICNVQNPMRYITKICNKTMIEHVDKESINNFIGVGDTDILNKAKELIKKEFDKYCKEHKTYKLKGKYVTKEIMDKIYKMVKNKIIIKYTTKSKFNFNKTWFKTLLETIGINYVRIMINNKFIRVWFMER